MTASSLNGRNINLMPKTMTDESIMPWGIHKGKTMANVPDHYLKWLYENNKCSGEVKAYIIDNADNLKIEI